MKNWQEMKDFSYVGIKITKAKTISEGLTKCKIEKLTRRNPLYEHLNFHKLIFGKKECQLCKSVSAQTQTQRSPYIHQQEVRHIISQDNIRSKTQPILTAKKQARPNKYKFKSWAKLQTAMESTLKQQIVQNIDKFKKVVNKFDDGLRKTKSTFIKFNKHQNKINNYFVTEIDGIEFNMHEDRALSIAQAKSDRIMMLEEKLQDQRRRKEISKKIKDMKRPVKFPLSLSQIKKIVDDQANIRKTETVKLKRMISSLYDYKSKINFQNKMKIVKKLTRK